MEFIAKFALEDFMVTLPVAVKSVAKNVHVLWLDYQIGKWPNRFIICCFDMQLSSALYSLSCMLHRVWAFQLQSGIITHLWWWNHNWHFTLYSFSETCFMDDDGLPTCDACLDGYTGRRCEKYVVQMLYMFASFTSLGWTNFIQVFSFLNCSFFRFLNFLCEIFCEVKLVRLSFMVKTVWDVLLTNKVQMWNHLYMNYSII